MQNHDCAIHCEKLWSATFQTRIYLPNYAFKIFFLYKSKSKAKRYFCLGLSQATSKLEYKRIHYRVFWTTSCPQNLIRTPGTPQRTPLWADINCYRFLVDFGYLRGPTLSSCWVLFCDLECWRGRLGCKSLFGVIWRCINSQITKLLCG